LGKKDAEEGYAGGVLTTPGRVSGGKKRMRIRRTYQIVTPRIMKKTTMLMVAVAMAVSVWVPVEASSPQEAHAERSLLSFSPVADAWVEESNPNVNYGSSGYLVTDLLLSDAERRSYLKFEVSGITDPVASAKLRVYARGYTVDGPDLRPVVADWDEGSITWNTRPAATARPVDDKGVILADSWVEFDVTDLVSGDGTYAFQLSPDSYDGVRFASKEATLNRPELLVETTPVTEHTVVPTVETTPVPHSGDAADDAAIWVNPSDPARSTIIGTDKVGGMAVYDLAGTQLQYRDEDARYNNVDLRTEFSLGDQRVALVAASDRTNQGGIVLYSVDLATGTLADRVGTIHLSYEPYGLCMYHSRTSGKFYVFVTSRHAVGPLVEQWELFDSGSGRVDARVVRRFSLGTQTEGCVADDELGHLYLAEEDVGIWRYAAEPDEVRAPVLLDETGPAGHLTADVEGLTIAYGPNGTGHLLASSQGNSSYTVYRREGSNEYVRTFMVKKGNEIDGTAYTDGIDVTAANLGSSFPNGLFIAHDGFNTTPSGTTENQNYKLIPLEYILKP
jgi:myo-inositol-hexaphosphate 3-phosphohydrolase